MASILDNRSSDRHSRRQSAEECLAKAKTAIAEGCDVDVTPLWSRDDHDRGDGLVRHLHALGLTDISGRPPYRQRIDNGALGVYCDRDEYAWSLEVDGEGVRLSCIGKVEREEGERE
jgi:hypothetical protein